MAFRCRRTLYVTLASSLAFITLAAVATAASRPNELDRAVDAIANKALLTQPAIALVDSARQHAANRLVGLELPGWIVMVLLEALALAYFWSSGNAAALRDRLRRRFRSENIVRFIFGAVLGLIARAAALLPAFYLYRVERVMQLSDEQARLWATLWIGHTLLAVIIAGLLAAMVLWLVDRTHQWYVFTILVILAASLGWSFAAPYFELPGSAVQLSGNTELGARMRAQLMRAGLSGMPIFLSGARNAPTGQAVVTGLGTSRRLIVSNSLIAASTQSEVLFLAADAIGETALGNPTFVGLIEGGIVIVFSALAVVIADRIGFRRDDDPLSRLALVGSLLAIVYLVAVPVRNASLRSYDLDADRYAVGLTGDRAAAVRALVRQADQRIEEVCPEMLVSFFLYAHPSVAARVEAINRVPSGCP
ncbi:MAG: M48 family metalloprotease [Candidatus Eremiobacteraeota bacterium]|nr:M48 family metalloprotease [Candidatus Eremiobacteraeota bacterium]